MARYVVFYHPGDFVPDRMKYVDDATDAPDANDDAATMGVTVGSLWLDTTNHRVYVCEDASTGAAVWTELTGGASSLGWFDVTDYGATGDGSTDDTSAVNSAIAALNSAGAGTLYFPAGTYKTTGGLTSITATCRVAGEAAVNYDEDSPGSKVTCTSATAVLFDVTSERCTFESLALVNTAATTPTAGAGIYSHAASERSRTDYVDLHVQGFYDDIDQAVGGQLWAMTRCMIVGPVRYGIRIRNTVNADAGDWTISDCGFYSKDYDSDAAIRVESSGGGKVVNTKINADPDLFQWDYGIDVSGNGSTSIMLVTNCSFENYGVTGYHADGNWSYQVIVGCQFGQYNGGSGNAIYIANTANVVIDDIALVTSEASKTAIVLSSVTNSSVGALVNNGYATLISGTPTYDRTGGVGSSVHITGTPTTGQVPTATGSTTATWQTPSGGGASSLDDLSDVDLTTDPPDDGDILAYDSGAGDFVPVAPSAASVTAAAVKAVGRWEPVQHHGASNSAVFFGESTDPHPFVYFNGEIVVAFIET